MGVPPAHPTLPGTKDSGNLDLGQLSKNQCMPAVPWPGLSSPTESAPLSLRPARVLASQPPRVAGTWALVWGAPQAQRGCGGSSALQLVLPGL